MYLLLSSDFPIKTLKFLICEVQRSKLKRDKITCDADVAEMDFKYGLS